MAGAAQTEQCRFCGRVFPWHECNVTPMTDEEEREALRALDAVTAAAPATNVYPPEVDGGLRWFCGHVTWRTPAGWEVTVYNDCNEWDGITKVSAPDGRVWEWVVQGAASPRHALSAWVVQWQPLDSAGWPGADEHVWPDPRPTEVEGRPYPLSVVAC